MSEIGRHRMNKALSDALKQALDFENKGKSIYSAAAEETANPIVARTFSYLAGQEDFHIKEIEKYIASNRLELGGDLQDETRAFFMLTVEEFKHKTSLSKDDIQAHETALELEKQSYDFYKKQFLSSKDPDIKQFFEFLMKQEKAHYELVEKTLQFIRDPVAFFQKDEEAIFEGG
jgi:rubrerythrin